jgi:hypothetical protein
MGRQDSPPHTRISWGSSDSSCSCPRVHLYTTGWCRRRGTTQSVGVRALDGGPEPIIFSGALSVRPAPIPYPAMRWTSYRSTMPRRPTGETLSAAPFRSAAYDQHAAAPIRSIRSGFCDWPHPAASVSPIISFSANDPTASPFSAIGSDPPALAPHGRRGWRESATLWECIYPACGPKTTGPRPTGLGDESQLSQ